VSFYDNEVVYNVGYNTCFRRAFLQT